MKVSVVVPAFNEERLLAGSLAAIRAATRAFDDAGWACELIVCDNNSTDRTAEIARAAGARVVFEPVNQIARARNAGAARASGEWLVFVDADSYPSRELFAEVVAAIRGGRALGGGATVAFEIRDPLIRLSLAIVERRQPGGAVGRGLVHLLRGRRVPQPRRVQRGALRRRGDRLLAPLEAPRAHAASSASSSCTAIRCARATARRACTPSASTSRSC